MDPLVQTLIQNLNELQLQSGVTYEEAKKRYKNLLVLNHPDKHQVGTPAHALAEAETKRINGAFAVITAYKDLLPLLAAHVGAAPPPNPPPNNPGWGTHASHGTTTQPGAAAPARVPTSSTMTRIVISLPTGAIKRHAARIAAVLGAVSIVTLAILLLNASEHSTRVLETLERERRAALEAEERRKAAPPPPRPSIWQPVIRDGKLPLDEVATLVGTSARAVEGAFRNTDYREIDINLDGKMELLITNIDGTCRREGCPVYLVQSCRGRLRDLLPNNYGWTSVTVLFRQTNGARDIIVTSSDWEGAQRTDTTPSQRECRRLVWSSRIDRYVMSDMDPPPESCFEAEKTAWNIPMGRTLPAAPQRRESFAGSAFREADGADTVPARHPR